jgi:P27 family predicted phage terminase small subunit
MRAGRPPKPTRLKILAGNPGKRELNPDEPDPVLLQDLTAPESLDNYGKQFWTRWAPVLKRMRLLGELDAILLEMAAERWSLYKRATEELKDGITVVTLANGRVAKPEVGIAKTAFDGCRAILQEFGIGPSSRTRATKLPEPAEDDAVEKRFFGGGVKPRHSARRFLA